LAAAAMLGSSACAKDSVSAEDTQQTGSSEDSTTTATESSDTGSTEGDTFDSASESNDTSLSFYAGPGPDHGSVSECDPFAQDCPEGEKCVPYGSSGSNWDANKCVPILGDGQPGDPCTYAGPNDATDDCAAESHCWDVMDVDGTYVGVCRKFCTGTPDDPMCPVGTSCLVANQGSITLCLQVCDPFAQDCPDGLGCYWVEHDFHCIFTTSDIPLGEPCGYFNDCIPGTGCMDTEVLPDCMGEKCCASYCSISAPECPQPGTECADFFDMGMALPGYEDIGICVMPGA
jgi:hypothetical protein